VPRRSEKKRQKAKPVHPHAASDRRRQDLACSRPAGGQARRDGDTAVGVIREGHGDTARSTIGGCCPKTDRSSSSGSRHRPVAQRLPRGRWLCLPAGVDPRGPKGEVIMLTNLEEFVVDHRPHGALTGDATEAAWNGYLLTVACPCGVSVGRWVTPQDAVLRAGLRAAWS
jgi:hypothetical protein